MHLPFTPNHVHLISACYPPSAALPSAGPEYLPNSQELSRLTYYASNRSGKINKVASELEKRVRTDCRKAQGGNIRCRASLLITLYIFKALANECRRDISLLTGSLLSAVNITLSGLLSDLEAAARAATVFTAWTTYTDGHLIGVDRNVTQNYMSCLQHFASMAMKQIDDRENRNRTRLLGLTSLTAVVHSEALFHQSTQFNLQVSTIMPALLTSILEVDLATLNFEAGRINEEPKFAFLDDFRTRPALERRAASIHLHVDGENGPSSADVVNTSLHALSSLFAHSVGIQASVLMSAVLAFFDDSGGWSADQHCRWIAAKAAEWTQYQYRYAVPTRLVECLVEGQDVAEPTVRHITLAAMITMVFTSRTPLVNLSTSDMISSLISLIFRRVSINVDDPLLPMIVECIASLGTHVYYADQIQDLAGDVIGRIILVESSGVPGIGKSDSERARSQALRCLLACLLGLMHSADLHEDSNEDVMAPESQTGGTGAELPAPREMHVRPSRRTKISPEMWHDTLVLLCDRDYAVRADYATALISYLQKEILKLGGDNTDADGIKRPRPLAESPSEQASNMIAMTYGDATTRFLNALHAYLYILATSSNMSLYCAEPLTSEPSIIGLGSGNQEEGAAAHEQEQPRSQSRRSTTVSPRSRKASIVLRAIQNMPKTLSESAPPAASWSDYGNILAVLVTMQESLPIRGLLIGVPMLLVLGEVFQSADLGSATAAHNHAAQQIVARVWSAIGRVWSCAEVVQRADEVVADIPSNSLLPSPPPLKSGTLPLPQHPVPIPSLMDSLPVLDQKSICRSLASSQNVVEMIGLDSEALFRHLTAPWNAENAFKDSIEANTSYESLTRDGLSPLVKVAPTLMHIDNVSMQSLARSARGVGVTDLRDALEGRSSISNPNLTNRAPSISTLDHASTSAHPDGMHKLTPVKSRPQRSKLAGPGEVRDVLNKLGIGKQHGATHLKSSFPTLQKAESRTAFTPPYKA
ncbi:uncharacterized protein LAESUDRAFT_753636 [Laetiporus sulphureus 93-53]|uniref:Protein EFR3 n=1 Tax=Laetiporus sulphureus 93-53 TaxID=1314785 RepID=A0A165I3Y1_9APHY|nr:uncharacterized protein LAESUDRAFT_753636 [Laetiporus sulphureus 93-53]KZT12564.1 hypothetical protein LAESUDRAFT_753636 [Laetiporus sulphureus 93-53]